MVGYDEARLWHAASLGEASGVDGSRRSGSTYPPTALTFDDGYVDFYTRVYPLLLSVNVPATLFVTTGFVEERKPYPMLSRPDAAVEPVTWEMLGEMAESGLVTLGAHTHTHPVLTLLPVAQVEEELAYPLELFERRLGMRPRAFRLPAGGSEPGAAYAGGAPLRQRRDWRRPTGCAGVFRPLCACRASPSAAATAGSSFAPSCADGLTTRNRCTSGCGARRGGGP